MLILDDKTTFNLVGSEQSIVTCLLISTCALFPLTFILMIIYVQMCRSDVKRHAQPRDPHLSIASAGRGAPDAGRGVKWGAPVWGTRCSSPRLQPVETVSRRPWRLEGGTRRRRLNGVKIFSFLIYPCIFECFLPMCECCADITWVSLFIPL